MTVSQIVILNEAKNPVKIGILRFHPVPYGTGLQLRMANGENHIFHHSLEEQEKD